MATTLHLRSFGVSVAHQVVYTDILSIICFRTCKWSLCDAACIIVYIYVYIGKDKETAEGSGITEYSEAMYTDQLRGGLLGRDIAWTRGTARTASP